MVVEASPTSGASFWELARCLGDHSIGFGDPRGGLGGLGEALGDPRAEAMWPGGGGNRICWEHRSLGQILVTSFASRLDF